METKERSQFCKDKGTIGKTEQRRQDLLYRHNWWFLAEKKKKKFKGPEKGCLVVQAGMEELIGNKTSVTMASSDVKPKSISRAKKWSEEIENLYRFQQAGYRDEIEYKQVKQVSMVDRWPETGYVKKLQRREDNYYYY
ncbi:meiosis expressed gene 1 protein homolog, partial [Pteropus vampyrus]|uniref:Meiosis expressed gene 1 protein homolog n=1 Tax=Pteropus vampyrus TaxID=132908 RepID=A0A6P3Q6S2_PTEVA